MTVTFHGTGSGRLGVVKSGGEMVIGAGRLARRRNVPDKLSEDYRQRLRAGARIGSIRGLKDAALIG